MEKKKKDNSWELITELFNTAKRANAGTAMLRFRKMKTYDNGDVYILFCKSGIDKFDAVESLVKSLSEDEE